MVFLHVILQASQFGFRCLVAGYESVFQGDNNGLRNLELELANLGGLCAASLMKKTLSLTNADNTAEEIDMELVEESAIDAFEMHAALLNKGVVTSYT